MKESAAQIAKNEADYNAGWNAAKAEHNGDMNHGIRSIGRNLDFYRNGYDDFVMQQQAEAYYNDVEYAHSEDDL